MIRRLPAVFGLLLVLLGCTLPACASVLNVPSQYVTIQSAIVAAQDGDTVLVAPGIYFENIDFLGKAITVTSTLSTDPTTIANATATTIIDGSSRAPAVTSSSPSSASLLSYFTIEHGGSAVAGGSASNYGGVYIPSTGPNLTGNVITLSNFGGVLAPEGKAQLVGNYILRNTCWGIVGMTLTATQNVISSILTPAAGGCTISNNQGVFTTNSTGILLLPSPPNLDHGTVIGPAGGNNIIGNTIQKTVQVESVGAPAEGGAGIILYGSSQLIQNNIIRDNSAPGGRGGAIDVIDAQETVIIQNLIYGNHAGCGGAAISFDSSGIQGQLIYDLTNLFYFETNGLVVAGNTIADNVDDANPGCPAAAQIEAAPDGVASPSILFVNNIISGAGGAAATACAANSNLFTQAVFDHNLINNAGGAFFGTPCVDESANPSLGNINSVPQFVDSSNGNYQLAAGSAGIDQGNNSIFEASNIEMATSKLLVQPLDLAGNPRVQDANGKVDGNNQEEDVIDIGAYEYTGTTAPQSVVGVFMQPLGYPIDAGYGVLEGFVNSNLGIANYYPEDVGGVLLTDVPTGTLTFYLDGGQIGQPAEIHPASWTTTGQTFYPMASGVANVAVLYTPGTHVLTATYQPSAGVTTAGSIGVVVDITTAATNLVLMAYPLNTNIGNPITYTVFGSSSYGGYVPASVQLIDVSTNKVLATIDLDPTTGMGTFTTSSLPGGPTIAQATFGGSGIYAATTSNQVGVFVTSPTTLTVQGYNPAYAFVPFTLTAQLTPAPKLIQPEYIDFYAATTGIATRIGVGTISASGMATSSVSLAAGTYTITANYVGDEFYGSSISTPITQIVQGVGATLTVTSLLNPANAFQPIPLKAHISPPGTASPGSITGTISFLANGSTVGSGTIDANGDATATISLAAGSYSIVASFAGNGSYNATKSAPVPELVNLDSTTTTLTVTPNPGFTPNENETLTATVTAASSKTVPPGTITFYDTFNNATAVLQAVPVGANGQAVLNETTLAPGNHVITATYGVTANFLTSSSAAVPLTIILRDFSLATEPSITIQTEHHASLPVTLASIGDFSDTITVVCSTLPKGATCNFPGSASFSLAQGGTVSTSIDIDTDAILNFASNAEPPSAKGWREAAAFALLLPLTLLSLRRRRTGRSGMRLLAALLALTLGLTLTACSGLQPYHTAPGTYAVTLTATGTSTGRTHTADFNLIVTK